MPHQHVTNITFFDLFGGTSQYEIPFFQRGYAWKKENWDQLFTDLNEQVLKEVEDSQLYADHEHFFGPVVVLEQRNSDPRLKRFLVVDGQQRITTVYLLLGVIVAHLRKKSHLSDVASKRANELQALLANAVSGEDDYRKLKVFSSKGDRLPTYKVIFGDENPRSPSLPLDMQLYNPRSNQVDAFHRYAEKKLAKEYTDVPALWGLAQSLLHSLKLVWIPLDDERDDPQAIFESLNDKGMRLSSSELLCSYVFRTLKNQDALHAEYWLPAVKEIGGTDEFETFLRCLVSIDQKKMVGKDRKMYVFFKKSNREMSEASARSWLSTIRDSAVSFNQIVRPMEFRHPDKGVSDLLVSIQETRMESSAPFVLAMLRAEKAASLALGDLRSLLKELLVLLVRRKAAELPVTKYDVFFPSLLSKLINEPNKIRAFHEATRKEGLWVSDQEFIDALVSHPLYRSRDLPFTRLVLREIDKSMQKFGQLPDYSTLATVEHILPQTLDAQWTAYLADDYRSDALVRLTDSLGNLCLLSQPANSSAGQDPFETKKLGYTDVSALAIDVKGRKVKWTLEAIQQRSRDLAEHAVKIWSWNS